MGKVKFVRMVETRVTRGMVIKAFSVYTGRKIAVDWDDSLDARQNHEQAARKLLAVLHHGCDGRYCGKLLAAERKQGGYIFVQP